MCMADKAPADLDAQNLVWTSASKDAAGSMPLGNGEVVLNVWVEEATGNVVFYIARTDALSEISRFLKLGAVRLSLRPNLLRGAKDFRQELKLRDGVIDISGGGLKLRMFVDSQADVVHVVGTSETPVQVTASAESWRESPHKVVGDEMRSAWSVHDAPFDLVESADTFLKENAVVVWHHRNETSVVPKLLENQSLTGLKGTFDPILHRSFGACLSGKGFQSEGDRSLVATTMSFDLRIATFTAQTPTVSEWRTGIQKEDASSADTRKAESRTKKWWSDFWARSWVFVDNEPWITRGYTLQRYVQACQGRGQYPIKFNGGYYTVEPKAMGLPFNADYRNWGDCHWWQNVRHMYHPMLMAGDFEMMDPLFRLYEAARPLAESRTKKYHGCEGAYFPETMTVFGTYSGGDYGWKREGLQPKDVQCPWWQYAWNQGPELVSLMLDRWDWTRDDKFLKEQTLPMAESVLRYFDTRFRKGPGGKIILDPTQAAEMYWTGVINDMPSTVGLIAITRRLDGLPEKLTTPAQRDFFARMRSACPKLPIANGMLRPAQKFDPKESNVENPELYAVWPFREVSLSRPQLLKQALAAYEQRHHHLDKGWGYDGNCAALLGMADEAARILKIKCDNSHPAYRWPATWGPNFDWLPDQNHGGNLLETTQLMLMQCDSLEEGGAIRLLPAWPKAWDVRFRLHAPGNTVVECEAKGGKITKLKVTPENRRKDVILPTS